MFKRVILLAGIIGFILFVIFIAYLRQQWQFDRDQFWISFSIAGVIVVFFSYWMIASARFCDIEDELWLKRQLESGKSKALALVNHLHDMGAGECVIPVAVGGRHYEVSVTPVHAKPCTCCGSIAREHGPEGLNPYCPHCGEPDFDGA